MKQFKDGVSFYTTGTATVRVHFPEDDVVCAWCPFCRSDGDLKRAQCRLTNDIIFNPFFGVADTCPIQFNK